MGVVGVWEDLPKRTHHLHQDLGQLSVIMYLCLNLRYAQRIGYQVSDLNISKIIAFFDEGQRVENQQILGGEA